MAKPCSPLQDMFSYGRLWLPIKYPSCSPSSFFPCPFTGDFIRAIRCLQILREREPLLQLDLRPHTVTVSGKVLEKSVVANSGSHPALQREQERGAPSAFSGDAVNEAKSPSWLGYKPSVPADHGYFTQPVTEVRQIAKPSGLGTRMKSWFLSSLLEITKL